MAQQVELSITASDCETALAHLVTAKNVMCERNKPRPRGGLDGLTDIATEIDRYLRGAQVARAALADAASTSAHSLLLLMGEARALDASLASSLGAGFAVRGSER